MHHIFNFITLLLNLLLLLLLLFSGMLHARTHMSVYATWDGTNTILKHWNYVLNSFHSDILFSSYRVSFFNCYKWYLMLFYCLHNLTDDENEKKNKRIEFKSIYFVAQTSSSSSSSMAILTDILARYIAFFFAHNPMTTTHDTETIMTMTTTMNKKKALIKSTCRTKEKTIQFH